MILSQFLKPSSSALLLSANLRRNASALARAMASVGPSPQYHRLRLRPEPQLPPRVEHLLVGERGLAGECIGQQLGLPLEYVEDLIDFGAVYYSSVLPTPPANLPDAVAEKYRRFMDAFNEHRKENLAKDALPSGQAGAGTKVRTLQASQRVRRVVRSDEILEGGSYVRVHVHPRRFPRCYNAHWSRRVVAETEEFVVVDKPYGVPVGGTVDNLLESTLACVGRALGNSVSLCQTHQLDICTEGCVILAKSKNFARKFNTMLKDRQVHKVYRVLSSGSPPVKGRHVHYMQPSPYPPRIVVKTQIQGWQRCELEVLEVAERGPLTAADLEASEADAAAWPRAGEPVFESRVLLISGRTHQIRAQFAYMGCPLVGDGMYNTPRGAGAMRWVETQLANLGTPEGYQIIEHVPQQETTMSLPVLKGGGGAVTAVLGKPLLPEWSALELESGDLFKTVRSAFGLSVDGPIGLQAWQVSWEDVSFHAGDAWWDKCHQA